MTTSVEVQHIEIDPGIRGGKPHIRGTRMTVSDIVIMHLRLGQSLEEIVGEYDLSLADVHAAMTWYYDHRAEIDKRIEEDAAYAEAFKRNNPSPLREKLNKLKHG